MRLVKACKTITTCFTTRPCWAPHQAISDVRLIGSRLVKNVTQLSQQQAGYPEPVHQHAGDIFYTWMRIARGDTGPRHLVAV